MSESGRIKGANNVKAFKEFIELHNQQDDWINYLNPSKVKLRRSDICEECGFSKSALRQNPLLKDMLKNLERELLQKGVLRNKCLQEEGFKYPDQDEFVKSYDEKLTRLRDSMDLVDKMIALYQSELERLD
ncbi:hypothetical protein SAMN04488072_109160 [Lentibacillus halodurans]|uniref:Uncharacterized protein n=1 Tax=Lentibacillus halodurans TaxID=237679 RepID=A0A1I0Z3W7_9BACI|nr:hypothetical protein [Lentibacillus halodurans]SFB20439.1 hypothetical protein SAMN04488072_109160 [Lentibacillus halodurans]